MTHQTTPRTTSSHLVPTSSRLTGRPQKSTSSQSVPPYGDDVELESNETPPENPQLVPQTGTSSDTPRSSLCGNCGCGPNDTCPDACSACSPKDGAP